MEGATERRFHRLISHDCPSVVEGLGSGWLKKEAEWEISIIDFFILLFSFLGFSTSRSSDADRFSLPLSSDLFVDEHIESPRSESWNTFSSELPMSRPHQNHFKCPRKGTTASAVDSESDTGCSGFLLSREMEKNFLSCDVLARNSPTKKNCFCLWHSNRPACWCLYQGWWARWDMRKAEQPHLGGRPSSLQNSIALASVFLRVLYPDYQPSSFSCALLSLLKPSNCF